MVLGGITAQALGSKLITAIKKQTSELLAFEIKLLPSASPMAGIIGSAMLVIDDSLDTYLSE